MSQIDTCHIQILVDNQTDGMSTPINNIEKKEFSIKSTQFDFEQTCLAGHGFAAIVTAKKDKEEHTILFDTGPSTILITHNSNVLGREYLEKMEAIVISHNHMDHIGGLMQVLKERFSLTQKEIPIYVHPHASNGGIRGFKGQNGEYIERKPTPTEEEISKYSGKYVYVDKKIEICNGFFVLSGEVPRKTTYEHGLKGHYLKVDNEWKEDPVVQDEQFLGCNVKDKGAVLLFGCSHFGVVNGAMYGMDLFTTIHCIIGGFHLAGKTGESVMKQSISDLKKVVPECFIVPGHCTGWRAKEEIQQLFKNKTFPSSVGSLLEF